MSLRSVTFTGSGSWRCPVGVSFAWFMAQGAGGGGDAPANFQDSKGSGGAGEFMCNVPMPVTANTIYTITLGATGLGAVNGGALVSDGGTTTFNGFNVLGGGGALPAAGATVGGIGGGPNGGSHGSLTGGGNVGGVGNSESPTAFGGCGGSTGGSPTGNVGFVGPQQIGEYTSSGGAQITSGHGGAGGGNSVLGSGGTGGNSNAGTAGNGQNGGYGAGGGGGGQDTVGAASGKSGGNGGSSFLTIMWIQP